MTQPTEGPVMRPASIPRRTAKTSAAVDFEVLRADGIRAVQLLSGLRWTDYNLHDPGVTILEQLCYALTELAFRADFPVADHLCGEDGRIVPHEQALFAPQQILPCRPTTAADYRAALMAEVPELTDAVVEAHPTQRGLLRLRLRLQPGSSGAEADAIKCARAAWRRWRTLGEDLDEDVQVVAERPCALLADVEVTGARAPEAVLAEVYHRCAQYIAAAVPLRSVDEMLLAGVALDEAYDGPPVSWRVDAARAAERAPVRRTRLVVGDLATLIRDVAGVRDVRDVRLQVGQDAPNARRVDWQGPQGALSLLVPGRGADLAQVRLTRRGTVLDVDATAVAGEYEDLRSRARSAVQVAMDGLRGTELPRGQHRPAAPYLSVAHHFPAVYGLGPQGMAAADSAAQARVTQLKTYLALFEQTLAHGQAQVAHLRELFAPARATQPSYWWDMLADAEVPGLGALYRQPLAQVQAQAFERFDDAGGRRHRALDQMLALYGQTYAQNTMRQFLNGLDTAEVERALLENKAQFLSDTLRLSQGRASGIDYAADVWLNAGNASGLQHSVSLLLGFTREPNHRLCPDAAPGGGVARGKAPRRLDPVAAAGLAALRPLQRPAPTDDDADAQRRLQELDLEGPDALLRAGVEWTRYRWRPAGADGLGALLLGPDEAGDGWELGEPMDEAAAARLAWALRRRLLELNRDSEGLHLVEHTLLRPRSADGPLQRLGLPADFFDLRVSVVFPDWTVRTAQPSFQRFAAESVQMSLPAHVMAQCLWLDRAAMGEFEKCYPPWLKALSAHALALTGPTAQALDVASADLAEIIAGRLRNPPGPAP